MKYIMNHILGTFMLTINFMLFCSLIHWKCQKFLTETAADNGGILYSDDKF